MTKYRKVVCVLQNQTFLSCSSKIINIGTCSNIRITTAKVLFSDHFRSEYSENYEHKHKKKKHEIDRSEVLLLQQKKRFHHQQQNININSPHNSYFENRSIGTTSEFAKLLKPHRIQT